LLQQKTVANCIEPKWTTLQLPFYRVKKEIFSIQKVYYLKLGFVQVPDAQDLVPIEAEALFETKINKNRF